MRLRWFVILCALLVDYNVAPTVFEPYSGAACNMLHSFPTVHMDSIFYLPALGLAFLYVCHYVNRFVQNKCYEQMLLLMLCYFKPKPSL